MTSYSLSLCMVLAALFAQPVQAYTDHDGDAILINPVDENYPIELLEANPQLPVKIIGKRNSPWYEKHYLECNRIFEVGKLTEKTKGWDGLERNLFLQRLDQKGARGIASQYPQFTSSQLADAEKELRKVKELP